MPQINERVEDRAQDKHFTTLMVKKLAQEEVIHLFQANTLLEANFLHSPFASFLTLEVFCC